MFLAVVLSGILFKYVPKNLFLLQKYTLVWPIMLKKYLNPLSANPTKWSKTLKQFVCLCLTILWGWRLKG